MKTATGFKGWVGAIGAVLGFLFGVYAATLYANSIEFVAIGLLLGMLVGFIESLVYGGK
jgi:hypothetical protein